MIELNDLGFSYSRQGTQVLEHLTTKLGNNHIYGLLGRNGEGKTTLLQIICGQLIAEEGTVSVDGMDTSLRLPQMLREIYLIGEELSLPDLKLKDIVRMHTDFYPRFSEDIFHKCMSDFGVEPPKHLSTLSAGQRKKVVMSLALASGTRYLLFDEPTNGLDIPSKTVFRRCIAANMRDDQTFIISTHLVNDVEPLLDWVLMLNDHKLVVDESVEEIENRYTFCDRDSVLDADSIIYQEPSIKGASCIVRRQEGDPETKVNLELFFNAVAQGLIH